ncbi:iron complex outermembrane receptor protein [Breznakibacter xylanolyticus]|uniref:Iron complex outermembrane receptor protein n=1 Tax=Breznakibacter xylanolyticus TaxID=990 RepID=A0A2W7QFM5_9BACT|nr:TonB-dependent receptor [Breznakibacter xylanolyticus]PZX20739.1 iron complex outermembrane receptor protein [Breznakibacter xylanolyticus]
MRKSSDLLKALFLMLGLVVVLTAQAQVKTVTGRVSDAANGDPMPGVTVVVKGTTNGTITTPDGTYSMQVADSDVLLFSFIGFKNQEVNVAGQSVINIQLKSDNIGMEEVVVIGYGVSKKKDLTGSVQTISAKDFNQGAITSPQQLMNGKVAGVQITDGGGAPGSKSTIRVRGGSSLKASNDPLIIVDGVPMDNSDVSGMSNPLSVVNPNDIETFTVLKDASATAIYGSRASNGVILITTKKGKGTDIHVDYTGNVSVNTPTKMVDVLDAGEYSELLKQKFPANAGLMGSASTDWQKEIYKTTTSTDHSIAIAGNVKKVMPFRASVGYNNSNGILDQSQMQRTTGSLNLNPSFFKDHLRINASMKGMLLKNNFSNTDAIGDAISMDPTQAVTGDAYEPFGGYFAWADSQGNPNANAPMNPRARIDQKRNRSTVNRFIGNFQADYKFHFLPELRANLNVGTDVSTGEDDGGVQNALGAAWDVPAYARGGAYNTYLQKKKNELLDFYLQYTKDLPDYKSRFDVMGGYSWQHFWKQEETQSFYNDPLDPDADHVRDPYKMTKSENYLVSFFGRANYVYDDRYYVTFTLRNDGSSRFSDENRWGLFPSLALAWNVKGENFLTDNSTVSNMKLRLGYGVTGQQDIGNDYGYFGVYTAGETTAAYVYYKEVNGSYQRVLVNTLRPEGYDANLKWEETVTYNAGIDYGFFNDRLYGALDVYLRKTNDLLNEIPVPAGANLENVLTTNVGNLENKGVEFSVNGVLIKSTDLTWELGANVTFNENEITKLTRVDDLNYVGVANGDISGGTGNMIKIHQVGQPVGSFFVYEQVYGQDGRPIEGVYVDRDVDGEITTADMYVAGNPSPKVMLGINTSLNYKNWDFSLSGRANLGMKVYNNIASNAGYFNRMQTSGQYLGNLNSDVFNTGFFTPQYFSDYYVKNASFFRLDNVTLGYRFKDLMSSKMNMRVYATVNNVFVLTDYDGIDPEVSDGIDRNIYPRPRTFLLGVSVSF